MSLSDVLGCAHVLFLEQLLLPLLLLPGVNATGGIAAVGWAAEEKTQTETKERVLPLAQDSPALKWDVLISAK